MPIYNASIVLSISVACGTKVKLQACKKISKHTETGLVGILQGLEAQKILRQTSFTVR
jgi:hypothetical protein